MADDTSPQTPEYMSLDEFQEQGFLMEINRQFLHPLGLAMAVAVNDTGRVTHIAGILDFRSDPEGIRFGPLTIEQVTRSERFQRMQKRMHDRRKKVLGYVVQPLKEGGDG